MTNVCDANANWNYKFFFAFDLRLTKHETRDPATNKYLFVTSTSIGMFFFCLVLGLVCAKMKLLLQIADTIEAPGKFSETRLCFGTGFQNQHTYEIITIHWEKLWWTLRDKVFNNRLLNDQNSARYQRLFVQSSS